MIKLYVMREGNRRQMSHHARLTRSLKNELAIRASERDGCHLSKQRFQKGMLPRVLKRAQQLHVLNPTQLRNIFQHLCLIRVKRDVRAGQNFGSNSFRPEFVECTCGKVSSRWPAVPEPTTIAQDFREIHRKRRASSHAREVQE